MLPQWRGGGLWANVEAAAVTCPFTGVAVPLTGVVEGVLLSGASTVLALLTVAVGASPALVLAAGDGCALVVLALTSSTGSRPPDAVVLCFGVGPLSSLRAGRGGILAGVVGLPAPVPARTVASF